MNPPVTDPARAPARFLAIPSMLSKAALAAVIMAAASHSAPAACLDAEPEIRTVVAESSGQASLPIRSLVFNGLRTTREDVVRRELRNRVGESFSCAKWESEKARLEDLDIFGHVDLETSVKDSGVILAYVFRELPPYIPFVAVSKTEQDGLSLGPALASLNFLGQGIRAEFISRFGGTTEFQGSLSSNRLWDLPLEYDLAVLRVDSYNRFESFHEDSWRVKLDLAQGLGASGWAESAHILYEGELFYLRDGVGDSGVLLSEGGDLVPRLGTGFRWDGRNRRHNPTRGFFQELLVTQNGGFLGGQADYREWMSDTRAYLPWHSRNTLALGGLYRFRDGIMGTTFGRYDQFHAGGINTLRGYGNDAFRGKSELILNAENRMDWIRKRTLSLWRWSAYYGLQGILGWEAASLWDHNALLERDFHAGMYAGVHILVAGADRIRFEAGSKFAKFQVEFDVGILDKAEVQRFRAR
jgi:outer membrane protein assembly factor BamA